MTTKDIVYLGLLALSAVVFYFNGYFAGLSRGRRQIEDLFATPTSSTPTEVSQQTLEPRRSARSAEPVAAGSGRVTIPTTIRAVFGKN